MENECWGRFKILLVAGEDRFGKRNKQIAKGNCSQKKEPSPDPSLPPGRQAARRGIRGRKVSGRYRTMHI